jgi:hypothetical protein
LYEAAKEYSTKIAYPDKDFPVIGPNDLCVLCQQELDDDARDRLQRFQQFMEDKSEQNLQSAQNELKSLTDQIDALNIPIADDYQNVLDELDDDERKKVEESLTDRCQDIVYTFLCQDIVYIAL